MRKKILILIQSEKGAGGIANYYKSLNGKFNKDVEYFERGARTLPYRKGAIREFMRAITDLVKFILKMMSGRYYLVQTSSSLNIIPLFRDGFFVLFAKLFRVKVIVFIRGWYDSAEKKIEDKYFRIFKWVYFKADAMIVLSSIFKKKLEKWGYNKKIYIETTVVNEELLNEVTVNFLEEKYTLINPQKEFKILFLASYLFRGKGVYETIDAYIELKQKYPNISLTIVGGDYLDISQTEDVKKYVKDRNLNDIIFTGYLFGRDKINVFKEHHIYIFPTYTEGMPNSLLEAISFGLPSITTPVGGIPDVFKHGINGFLVPVGSYIEIVNYVEELINDIEKMKNISLYNYNYARKMFTPQRIIERLENIYEELNNK